MALGSFRLICASWSAKERSLTVDEQLTQLGQYLGKKTISGSVSILYTESFFLDYDSV